MPVSIAASGSQTATLATDHTLATQAPPSGGAAYVLVVDKSNLAGVEVLRLRLRTRARSGDSTIDCYEAEFTQDGPDAVVSPVIPVEASNEVVAILRQEGGTGRAFPWALKRIDG
jgi:hypothetical protein